MKIKKVLSVIFMTLALLALIVSLHLMNTGNIALGVTFVSAFSALFPLGLNFRTEYNCERIAAVTCFIEEVGHILERFIKVPYFWSYVPDDIIESCLQKEQERTKLKSLQFLRWAQDREWDECMSCYFAEIECRVIDESISADNRSNDDSLDFFSEYIIGDLSKELEYTFQMYVEVGDISMTDLSSCLYKIKCSCEKELILKAQSLYEYISSEILFAKSITENLVKRSRRYNFPCLEIFHQVRRLNERWFAQEHRKTDEYERIIPHPKVVNLVYEQVQEVSSYVLKKRILTGAVQD